jgi:hypothetical protein
MNTKRTEINDLLKTELFKIDEADSAGTYDRQVHVLHQDGSEFMARKSLTYFEDADLEEMPVLFENISWNEIKQRILDAQ